MFVQFTSQNTGKTIFIQKSEILSLHYDELEDFKGYILFIKDGGEIRIRENEKQIAEILL